MESAIQRRLRVGVEPGRERLDEAVHTVRLARPARLQRCFECGGLQALLGLQLGDDGLNLVVGHAAISPSSASVLSSSSDSGTPCWVVNCSAVAVYSPDCGMPLGLGSLICAIT